MHEICEFRSTLRSRPSQAKLAAWEAHHCEMMLDQYTFGKRPGWTHSQQHCRRHSMFEQEKLSDKNKIIMYYVYVVVRYAARTGQNGHEHSVSARLDAVFIEL